MLGQKLTTSEDELLAHASLGLATAVKHIEDSVQSIAGGDEGHEPHCERLQVVRGKYLQYLSSHGLWPTYQLLGKSVLEVTRLLGSERPSFQCTRHMFDSCGLSGCKQRDYTGPDLYSDEAISRICSQLPGLCVHCVHDGENSKGKVCTEAGHNSAGEVKA